MRRKKRVLQDLKCVVNIYFYRKELDNSTMFSVVKFIFNSWYPPAFTSVVTSSPIPLLVFQGLLPRDPLWNEVDLAWLSSLFSVPLSPAPLHLPRRTAISVAIITHSENIESRPAILILANFISCELTVT